MNYRGGVKYKDKLDEIGRYLVKYFNGDLQENPEVLVDNERGRCYYDKCLDKKISGDKCVKISRNNRDFFKIYFHERCMNHLVAKSICSLN